MCESEGCACIFRKRGHAPPSGGSSDAEGEVGGDLLLPPCWNFAMRELTEPKTLESDMSVQGCPRAREMV